MTKPNESPQIEPRRRRRVRRARRRTAGVVAQYIHELSERHAEARSGRLEARRGRLAPASSPSPGA